MIAQFGSMNAEGHQSSRPNSAGDVDWSIYAYKSRWPDAAERVFLPDAVDQLADTLWGSDDADLDPVRASIDTVGRDDEEVGVLWTMVNLFSRLFVDGAMTTFAQPVSGGDCRPMRSHSWTKDAALRAVSEGALDIHSSRGEPERNWIFLDRVEFDLLMTIYAPAGGPPDDVLGNLQRRHDRLSEIILGNLPAIAGTARATLPTRAGPGRARTGPSGDPTPEELDAMFSDAKRVLLFPHQQLLIARASAWLLGRFDEDEARSYTRPQLRKMSEAAFHGYMTDYYFEEAWRVATAERPERSEKGRRPRRR